MQWLGSDDMRGKKVLTTGKMDDMHSDKVGVEIDPKTPGPPNKTMQCFIRRKKISSFTLWQKPPPIGWTAPFCRICLMEDDFKKFLTPCSCSGTMKYVHPKCLKRWCTGKRDAIYRLNCLRAKPKERAICDICHQPYKMQAVARDEGKFLLAAARKVQDFWGAVYIISSNRNPSKESDMDTVGKVETKNFLKTESAIYDGQLAYTERLTSSNKVSPALHARLCKVADVKHHYFFKPPESMECSQRTIFATVIDLKKSAHTLTEFSTTSCNEDDSIPVGKELKSGIQNCHAGQFQSISSPEKPLVLKSYFPEWSGKHKGHFTHDWHAVLLRHNGKLIATCVEPNQICSTELMRFGRIGKDLFFMHYSYPLSAFQAFAIFLSLSHWHNVCAVGQEIQRSEHLQQ